MPVDRRERKDWARSAFVGLQNIIAPSFLNDFRQLDEAGVRLDVRQSIAHGFFGTLCACEAGLTLDENKRFVQVVAEEAGKDLLVGVSLFLEKKDEMLALARHAEQAGAQFAMLGFPLLFNPKAADEVVAFAREICEATNLAIVLPANRDRVDLTHLHPSGVSFEVFDKLVEIDNVVAMLIGGVETGLMSECFARYGQKVLVSTEFFGMAPLLANTWGVQWSGGWMYEALQSPDHPHAVEFFDLVRRNELDAAMKLYWHMAPGMATYGAIHEMFKPGGNDNYQLRKYYQWCVGGNGGLTRQPHFNLFQRQKDAIRDAYDAMGVSATRDSEELFYLGRSQYHTHNAWRRPVSDGKGRR